MSFDIREKLEECTTGPGSREPDELEYLQIALVALMAECSNELSQCRKKERPNFDQFIWQGALSVYRKPDVANMLLDIETLIYELKHAFIIDDDNEN